MFELSGVRVIRRFYGKVLRRFKGPKKIVRDNKSSSYPVFELPGVHCTYTCKCNFNSFHMRVATFLYERHSQNV